MALPDSIEVVPLDQPVRAEITVPGSKSITNRALILAALADGEVTLKGALWSEDTQIMVACLKELGFVVHVAPDPDEPCNRTLLVVGGGGQVPAGGTETEPMDLFVGNAGTAARFLAPFLCLGRGAYRLHGVPRMHERPQSALFQALRELGYRVESERDNDQLPVRIYGVEAASERKPGSGSVRSKDRGSLAAGASGGVRSCRVNIEQSSQFASALLLSATRAGWRIEIVGENAEESPYVAMTSKLIEAFPNNGGTFQVEPDASSGSYFLAANELAPPPEFVESSNPFGVAIETRVASRIQVNHWPASGWQIDENFPQVVLLGEINRVLLEIKGSSQPAMESLEKLMRRSFRTAVISRERDLGDSIMMAVVLSCAHLLAGSTETNQFTDLGRLRLQECERVVALRTELTKCGAKVVEEGDTLTVWPSVLHGAEIETYQDHRMAMCFAILGLKVPGIRLKNPGCVKKTFPNFFQKLAAPPPHGLGAAIWEIRNGRRTRPLSGHELFAA